MFNIKKSIIIPFLFLNTSLFAEIEINILKNEKVIQKNTIDEKNTTEFESKYPESYTFISMKDNKPVVLVEPMGVKFKIFKRGENNYLKVFIKTENKISLKNKDVWINTKQDIKLIEQFGVQTQTFEYDIKTTVEDLVLEIGKKYKLIIKNADKKERKK